MGIRTKLKIGAGLALAVAVALPFAPNVLASDHDESPMVKANAALDITDLYVFTRSEQTVIIVAWAGFTDDADFTQPTKTGVFLPNVLYTIHIDNNGDNVADHKIHWRFSENMVGGKRGIEWNGIPGAGVNVVHPVEEVYKDTASGAQLWTGHADDPFFFDALGYLLTLESAGMDAAGPNLKFGCLDPAKMCDSSQDFLAGLNVTAAAIQIDHAKLGAGPIQVWATASKKP